jgi:hypothetical protein
VECVDEQFHRFDRRQRVEHLMMSIAGTVK